MEHDYTIIKFPLNTEKAIRIMERENKLLFNVALDATKPTIKKAVERLFNVKVMKVNTYITPQGAKRAYVTLSREHPAMDIMTKLGLV